MYYKLTTYCSTWENLFLLFTCILHVFFIKSSWSTDMFYVFTLLKHLMINCVLLISHHQKLFVKIFRCLIFKFCWGNLFVGTFLSFVRILNFEVLDILSEIIFVLEIFSWHLKIKELRNFPLYWILTFYKIVKNLTNYWIKFDQNMMLYQFSWGKFFVGTFLLYWILIVTDC